MDSGKYLLFEKYLNDELSAPEREEFDKRISTDPVFATEFNNYKNILDSLEAREDRKAGEEELRQNLSIIAEEYFNRKTNEKQAKIIPMRRILQLVAAGILILVGTWYLLNRLNTSPIDQINYPTLALAQRGDGDSLKVVAENAFNRQDFEKAAPALEQLYKLDTTNIEVKLYFAITLMETDQFTQANSYLTEITQGNSVYQYKAAWFLAINYLKQGNTEASKDVLQKIPESATEHEQARKLLEQL